MLEIKPIEKAKLIKPDIVLMDLGLPDITGIEATKQILEYNNNIKIIFVINFRIVKFNL